MMDKAFIFDSFSFSPENGELVLNYAYKDGPEFQEKITFPGAPFDLSVPQKEVLETCFFHLLIAAGVSYYKAYAPARMEIKPGTLTQKQADFYNKMYVSGLGQFAIENGLDLQGKINFPFDKGKKEKPFDYPLSSKVFVPVGGGKDSCVTMELLKESVKFPLTAFCVNEAKPITDCMEISKLPSVKVNRQISQTLLDLNKSGAVLNGHVPITGIIAFILMAAAVLYDTRFVAMSCERSANVGNCKQGDLDINHQWSKSFEFEEEFWEFTQGILPDFHYFSILRPFSEIMIARLFGRMCEKYFDVFTSCNKAFKLDAQKRLSHWCGDCDKCRFVFLMLAPFMDKEKLIQAIGNNPLDDLGQEDGFKELLGLSGYKPFECVGEVGECRLALLMLGKEWAETALVKKLLPLIKDDKAALAHEYLTPSATHHIPPFFKKTAIWGAGVEGKAVHEYLKSFGYDAPILTEDDADRILDFETVFKSPGVSLYRPLIEQAKEKGVLITSSARYFMENVSPFTKTVAVTGTKGKSTTSSLLAHLLKARGFNVAFGGNIGVPLVSLLGKKADVVVMELSSYQTADLTKGADLTILTNLYPEHLDWHQTHERYYADKVNLLRIRAPGAKAFVNFTNERSFEMTQKMPDIVYFNEKNGIHIDGNSVKGGEKTLFDINQITSLLGVHNIENICAVLSVLKEMDIPLAGIAADINMFQSLPHRLQIIHTDDKAQYVDDSISTTPETTIAALEAFAGREIILLAGGYDRGQDYHELVQYIKAHKNIHLIALPGTGERLFQAAEDLGISAILAPNMAAAVGAVKEKVSVSNKGNFVVLLSPGAPSYNLYKNFEERGEDFKKLTIG